MSANVTKLLLAVHVLAAIVAIGPVTVAASMFPAALRRGDLAALRTLHRICRVYAALGVVVPVFGLATASSLGVLGDTWLITSIVLTVVAAAVLGLVILPSQSAALARAVLPDGTPPEGAPPDGSPTTSAAAAGAETGGTETGGAETGGAETGVLTAGARTAGMRTAGAQTAGMRTAGAQTAGLGLANVAAARRLGMVTGVFNLLWTVVVVLMIVRPGSTTGV
jgi:hypothetical protein